MGKQRERVRKGERYWVVSPDRKENPRVYPVIDTRSEFDDRMWSGGHCHYTRESAIAELSRQRREERRRRDRLRQNRIRRRKKLR